VRRAEAGRGFVGSEEQNEEENENSGENEGQFPPGNFLAVLEELAMLEYY
jgi:hypothetical protein